MKRLLFLAINLILVMIELSSINSSAVYAQRKKEEPLKLEWVQKDVDGVAVLLKLTPVRESEHRSSEKTAG